MIRPRITRVLVLISLLLTPAESLSSPLLGLAGDIGIGVVDNTATSTIQAGLDIQEGKLLISFFGRVRIMLHNNEEHGILRDRDWDEASDFVHILRTLKYSRQFKPVYLEVKVGELLGYTLGHGTLLRDYSSIADPDHQHTGLRFLVAHDRFEVQGLLDNFINPAVVGLRLGVTPFKAVPGLKVGVTSVLDPSAPVEVKLDDEGRRAVDSAWNLQSRSQVLPLLSADISYALDSPGKGRLEPYVAGATSFFGGGFHGGLLAQLSVAGKADWILGIQGEYHYSSAGYAPTHIDTFYDIDRHQAGLTFDNPREAQADHRSPKLAGLARGIYGGHGGMVQLGLSLGRLARGKLGYAYRPGPDAHRVWARISSTPIPRLNLGLLLMMRGVESPHGVAGGVAAMAEGRIRITQNIYGLCQYSRTWSLDERTRYFGMLQLFNFSVGANLDV